MHTVSVHQRQILDDLIARLSVPEIAKQHATARQRIQAQIEALRSIGVLSTDLPDECIHKELHPQDSRPNPWPPPARYARLFPNTDHEIVVRSVLLPRADGATLPIAVPDTRIIVLTRPRLQGSISWEVSRRERWALADTEAVYTDWTKRYASLRPRLPVPVPPVLDTPQWSAVTLVIAWAIDTEAILYSSPAEVAVMRQ
jgi:hypothetical protein